MQRGVTRGSGAEAGPPHRRFRAIGAWTALLLTAPFLLAGLALVVPIFAVMEAWDWMRGWKSYNATEWWNETAHQGRFRR